MKYKVGDLVYIKGIEWFDRPENIPIRWLREYAGTLVCIISTTSKGVYFRTGKRPVYTANHHLETKEDVLDIMIK